MSTNHVSFRNWPRYLLQWGTIAAIILFLSGLAGLIFPNAGEADPEAYCPMGGLQALTTYLVNSSLPCSMTAVQLMMGIMLSAGVILFSKLFCAYLCPIGTVEELVRRLRISLHINAIDIDNGSFLDKILRIVKYILLFTIFYVTATSGELFCKHFDPYYAVASGFHGDITLWLCIFNLIVILVGGFVVDSFWCRYICPLGAASNSLKFWFWIVSAFAAWYTLNLIGLKISWVVLLLILCIMGYALEILSGKPKLQLLHLVRDENSCNHCGACTKACPYHVDIRNFKDRVNSVDCTLCGECISACDKDALNFGFSAKEQYPLWRLLPAILAVALVFAGVKLGGKHEFPTVNEIWGIEDYNEDSVLVKVVEPTSLKSMEIDNLRSVKCFGTAMVFKARCQQIEGVHGVKVYVSSHRAVITYDPILTRPVKIRQALFVPSRVKIKSPDPMASDSIRIYTVRTDNMFDRMDLNYLGLMMESTGRKIYALESEYSCPLAIKVYADVSEKLDASWFRDVINSGTVSVPLDDGDSQTVSVEYEFVRLEKKTSGMGVPAFLKMMFDTFSAEYDGVYDDDGEDVIKPRTEIYKNKRQYVFEFADQSYENPETRKNVQCLGSHLSREEGTIGIYLELNKDLVPSIKIRFSYPMTSQRLWELMNMDVWTVTYGKDDVREEEAKMKFEKRGKVYPYGK